LPRKLNKIVAEYDSKVQSGELTLEEKKVLENEAEGAIEIEGETLILSGNRQVSVDILPSLHTLLNNAKITIDSELRRFARESKRRGLDAEQHKSYASTVNSLCRLINTEYGISKVNKLETIADEKLQTMAVKALKAFQEDKDG
jgi:hypothetical protein|tara:strand:- start:83 stop:514 length:432 start_codon:yes stop_codon:yes gene_type:complete